MSKEQYGNIRRIGPERESQGLPLMQILGKTVVEFNQFPKGREKYDFPDTLAYFRNITEENLVMLRRRRPISYSPHGLVNEGV